MWLVDGDRSTSFFHAKASYRHQRNLILGLCDAEGVWQEDDQRIENIVVDYYTSIFKSNGPTNASTVVNAIQPVVIDAMNNGLVQEFQAIEVVKALKQMHPKRTLAPDGMPLYFISITVL